MKKIHKKHNPIMDKVPYILLGVILIMAVIIFFSIRSCMPLNFFSGVEEETEEEIEYTLFISSPTNDKPFSFINESEQVPIEIRAPEVENTDYIIKVLVNDNEIKSFTSPPYEYNWNPGSSGEYEMTAQLIDNTGNIIATSNTVNFTVQYEIEPEGDNVTSVDIEEKKNQVLDQAIPRIQNTTTGVPIFSYKCYTAPVIDGSIDEWDKFESFSAFTPTILKEHYTSHTDISGTFFSCWDNEKFYFAIRVMDDVFSQNYTGNQINKGDSIMIVFDTELADDMQISFYNSDDYRIDFSPGNFTGIIAESFMNWPSNAPPRGVDTASTRIAGGYIIEASIPWYNFTNYIPEDLDVLGFTVSIFDTDQLPLEMPTTELVISSSKVFDFNNVSMLGAIALIDAGDIQSTEEEPADEDTVEEKNQ
ncbi:MAG: sugar-binding protein [Actinomycetota bacterium]|nr:sugar-binding protein [Actinomycetota bacterium]